MARLPIPTVTLVIVGVALGCATTPPRVGSCPQGFDATLVQPATRELGYDPADWARELRILRSLGLRTVVLQYSGDETGPYDGRIPGAAPVRALLDAAERFDIEVYLGLFSDPKWPSPAQAEILPPPLADPAQVRRLAALCGSSPVCAGWYLSQEIDDRSWAPPEARRRLRAFLGRAAQTLRGLAPTREIAIAPFFTGALPPDEHAHFWKDLLADRAVDVLMLQDGVGVGRATPERAAEYLDALRPVCRAAQVRLWSVVELFRQIHGPPHDDRPFAAEPASFEMVWRSLSAERLFVERAAAFAVLDHMHPRRGPAARKLYRDYADWCAGSWVDRVGKGGEP